MSKGIDIVALLEWAERQKTFKTPKAKSGRKQTMKDFDPVEYVSKRKAEVERWEKYLKDQEKLSKKEEKKEDPKKSFSFLEWYIIGALSYPFLGPMYQYITHAAGVK